MSDDLMKRSDAAINRLHRERLAFEHPNKNHEIGEIFSALALLLEMQRDLAREQRRIIAMLDHR